MIQVAVHELAAASAVVRRMGGRLKRRTDPGRDGGMLRRVAHEYGSRGAAGPCSRRGVGRRLPPGQNRYPMRKVITRGRSGLSALMNCPDETFVGP
jgi:hypothetical protein